MRHFALLLATGTMFASPALAADVVYDEPPAPVAVMESPGWTGFYVGVQAGGAFDPNDPELLDVDTSFPGGVVVGGVPQFTRNFASENDSSFLGGAHVGYDYQMNNFVVGALVDINAIDYSESSDVVSVTAGALYQQERSIDYLATARLRAGYLVTPSALAYVTGGLAYADVENQFNTNSTSFTGSSTSDDDNDFGFSVGGGMEVKVTDNISFGAEYLYTNLGSDDNETTLTGGPFSGPGGTGETSFSNDEDFDFHTVTAKMSYRFN